MRTDSVITIAGAHDARTAVSRLTRPVPDRSRRAGIPARGGGEKMKASDVEAAGRPARARPGAAAGHPVREQRQGRRSRFSLPAPGGARRRASARAGALGRGRRQLMPALLGVG
jgi:hypothetical protein